MPPPTGGALGSGTWNFASSLSEDEVRIVGTRGHAIAQDMTQGMNDAVSYIGRKGHEADQRIEGAVAANPYMALGLAAGLGLILGALTRR